VQPLGSHDQAFDCYVINLAIVLSLLPLVLETQGFFDETGGGAPPTDFFLFLFIEWKEYST
jgi:hypothetical protein